MCHTPYPVIRKRIKSFLSYTTVKMVQIDSPRLGGMHMGITILIIAYVLVYPLLYETKYLEFSKPIGAYRFNLQGPTVDACKPTSAGNSPCLYDFSPVTALPYCSQYNGTSPALQQEECADWDAFNVVSPVTGTDEYITTRVREDNQTLVCTNPGEGECRQTYAFVCQDSDDLPRDSDQAVQGALPDGAGMGSCAHYQQRIQFMADIERFTLLISHSVQAAGDASIQSDIAHMNGYLASCTGEHVHGTRVSQGEEYFTIQQLLDAAQYGSKCGIDLDTKSSVPGSSHSVRYDGISLSLAIVYANSRPFTGPQHGISYEYHISAQVGAKSHSSAQVFHPYPKKRTIRNQAGIKIEVAMQGQLGKFSLTALFLQLSTSVAMLAFATVAVDFLATTVLQHHKAYAHAKTEEYQFGGRRGKTLFLVTENADGTRTLSERRRSSNTAPLAIDKLRNSH